MVELILNNSVWLVLASWPVGYLFYLYLTFFVKIENSVEPEKLVEAYFLIAFAKKRDVRYRESISEKRMD